MITTILAVLLLIMTTAIVNAVALLVGVLLLRVPRPGFQQVYTCSLVVAILGLLVGRVIYLSYDRGILLRMIALVGGIAAVVIVPPILLRYQFRTSWVKSVGVSVLWLVGSAAAGLLGVAFAAVTTHKAYVVPTNAMAPTINGSHRIGTCPHCGGAVVVSASADALADENAEGICSSCWKIGQARDIHPTIVRGERILASPFLRPKRWDIVTYYPPVAPNVLYTHRLVGLPGEAVLIKDGQLWINGAVQTPPTGLQRLMYAGSQEMQAHYGSAYGLDWGIDDKPCHLAADECFVLGDNTFRSSDSRFFGPVKWDQVTGVVTARYWPPKRVNVLRNSSEPLR